MTPSLFSVCQTSHSFIQEPNFIAPDTELSTDDPGSLDGLDMSLLFEERNTMSQLFGWMWYPGYLVKPKRTGKGVFKADVEFSDGNRQVALSYLTYKCGLD